MREILVNFAIVTVGIQNRNAPLAALPPAEARCTAFDDLTREVESARPGTEDSDMKNVVLVLIILLTAEDKPYELGNADSSMRSLRIPDLEASVFAAARGNLTPSEAITKRLV
jgi:hypothetical protein